MTPVGDAKVEIVLQIAVRGRTREMVRLLEAVNNANAVVVWFVENPIASEQEGQKGVTTSAGVNSV